MQKKRIKIGCPNIDERDIKAVKDTLSAKILSTGEKVEQFEQGFAKYIGRKYAVAVTSGSVALELALKICLNPKDKVLASPFNCSSVLFSIANNDLSPVWTDIDDTSFNISPDNIPHDLSSIKGLLITHLYGYPCDMDAFVKITEKNNLVMIEDFAQAPGASYKKKKLGTYGQISICSFGATKSITTAEGGMILTDDEHLHQKIRHLANNKFGDVGYPLYNFRMNDLQAALGLVQLEKYPDMLKRRRKIAGLYFEHLKDCK
ncbi:MAG: DegT/DnrJ/EryC1/StrS aminotransferase family protein, partial [Desulfobacteraceae bacterium]|nr:DegT/DnrJ/EryC1/StrS aminotransferase family protein [Desulfobacteraceae bacterium]